MPTAVPRIAPPWALPRGSTLLTLLSHVWGLFPSSPLRRFTLCFFSSWLPVGCSWPCSHLYLQSVQKALSTEQAPLLKAKGWAISICCSTSWILPETWFLFSSHPCTPWLRLHTRMCKHTHTHSHTCAQQKRKEQKSPASTTCQAIPSKLTKFTQGPAGWLSVRWWQNKTDKKARGGLEGGRQGLLSLAPLNIFPLLWSNVCII